MLKVLKHVLGWPVTGPTFLLGFGMRQLHDTALREVSDDTSVREELLELQLLLELGEIDEEEYVAREAELMRRLREVREWRGRLGLPGAGGAMSFQELPAPAEAHEAAAVGGDAGEPGADAGGDGGALPGSSARPEGGTEGPASSA